MKVEEAVTSICAVIKGIEEEAGVPRAILLAALIQEVMGG